MKEFKCPLCGSPVETIWYNDVYSISYEPVTKGFERVYYTATRCINPNCNPVKCMVDGEELYTFAVLGGHYGLSVDFDTQKTRDAIEFDEKSKYVKEVAKMYGNKHQELIKNLKKMNLWERITDWSIKIIKPGDKE